MDATPINLPDHAILARCLPIHPEYHIGPLPAIDGTVYTGIKEAVHQKIQKRKKKSYQAVFEKSSF